MSQINNNNNNLSYFINKGCNHTISDIFPRKIAGNDVENFIVISILNDGSYKLYEYVYDPSPCDISDNSPNVSLNITTKLKAKYRETLSSCHFILLVQARIYHNNFNISDNPLSCITSDLYFTRFKSRGPTMLLR
jgi:hypothetical protein